MSGTDPPGPYTLLDFHNKVTTSETLISDNKV